jgi:hypothetical protein
MDNPIETAASRVHMPATALSALAMSLFMQQITSSSQVRSNGLQEALSRVHSRCRLIQTDRFEFLIIVLLAGLKDAMQICGKLPGQETLVDKFPIKRLMAPWCLRGYG